MINNILFTANIVAPVFLIIALGYFSKKMKIINENFVDVTSKFVFSVSLPALVFMQIAEMDLSKAINFPQIIFIYIGTIASFILIWLISIPFIKDGRDRSVFIQGAFRSNFAIVGFAIISNLFGTSALGKAAIILAFILPLYNVLAVIVLTVPLRQTNQLSFNPIIKEILLNPLIVAVIVGLPFSYFAIKLPSIIITTGNFLSDLALPLALIGIGGSLNLEQIKKASTLAFTSSFIKLILIPLILTSTAYFIGYRGIDLGIMFILFACPTAIVSFIMAEAMGANSKLAGNIILISTLGSVFTIAVGILILKTAGLI
ncbi:AEC family transporter [Ignavibacterium sp.]|uniref:AEC family transporter n=1 Tax=Ignavibacterium sp. TaxID=2651167 RepID=UPI0021F9F24C|nr:AEC family transporter [Ignavibacterium sp.]BDQ03175.1 MAG: transporter [Ignavibacterium sp.]